MGKHRLFLDNRSSGIQCTGIRKHSKSDDFGKLVKSGQWEMATGPVWGREIEILNSGGEILPLHSLT